METEGTPRQRDGGREDRRREARSHSFRSIAVVARSLCSTAVADARPDGAGKGKRPNILVVMTDDMAQTDLQFMPKSQRMLADKGTTFADAVDSFPLCCPARATFITGQYAHNHGVEGNFAPFGWYGMKNRGNTLPAWLDDAGYDTAAIGKWLNGYGALDAHGEVPKGFDTWRGLLDVSAYDYFNYVMNRDGKLKTWGDEEFARKLVEFAHIEVDDQPDSLASIFAELAELFGPAPYDYWGAEKPKRLLARRDRPGHPATRPRRAQLEEAVLHLVVARRSSSRGRLDHADGAPGAGSAAGAALRRRERRA